MSEEQNPTNVKELLNSNDPDDIAKAEQLLDSGDYDGESGELIAQQSLPPEQQPAQEKEPVQQQQDPTQQQQSAQPPEAKYEIKDYHGKTMTFDDSDGFLGSKNIDTFKKRFVDTQDFTQKLLAEKREVNAERKKAENEAKRLKYEFDQYKQQQAQSAQPPVQPQTQQQQQPGQPEAININRPDVPEDPANWSIEDSGKIKDWQENLSKYTTNIGAQTQDLSKNYENVNKTIQEQQELISLLKQEREDKQFQDQENSYWSDIDNLSNKVDSFKLPENVIMKNVHSQILAWSENAAAAAGILQQGDDEFSQDTYVQQRDDLVQRFVDGDQEVTDKLKSVLPPQGFKQYFGMVDLNRKRQSLIDKNVFAQNSTLEDTYAYLKYKDGSMDKTFNQVQKEAMINGQQSVLNAMAQTQQQFANTLPNNPNIQTDPQSSEKRMAEVLTMDPAIVEGDPKLKLEYDKYLELASSGDLSSY